MIKRLSEIQVNIENIVKNPIQRGKETGFRCLDELYSIKKGSFTIWQGSPAHGKSELIFEMLINLAIKYGERSIVYSPETGSAEEIMIELAHKFAQKQIVLHKKWRPVCTEREMYEALNWVDHHFIIVDGDEDGYSFKRLCEEAEQFEKENKCFIANIMAEPYNEIVHDMKEFGGRQDLYIESFITEVRRYCKKNNKHCHLSIHPGHQQMQKVGNINYYPMPMAREAAGGQAALRKAMTWINIWRPKQGLKNQHGMPYLPNEVLVNIEKAKPKYISERGTCSLFFDGDKNRYYEKIVGSDCYAFDHLLAEHQAVQELIPVQAEITFEPPVTADNEFEDYPF